MKPNSLLTMLLTIFSAIAQGKGSWWDSIHGNLQVVFPIVLFFVSLFVLSAVLYLAGLVIVGGRRALFSDAVIISLLGTVLSTLFFMFIPYSLLALGLSVIVWLLLIKRFYETGWLGAIGVGIMALIIFLVVVILLALVFGILTILLERFSLIVIAL